MAIFGIVSTLIVVPAVTVGHFMIDQAVGRVTVAADAEGRERAVYWREYPGMAGVDPQEILQGPTPEEGLAAGQAMISEVRAALTEELGLK